VDVRVDTTGRCNQAFARDDLGARTDDDVDAVLVHLVDLPDVTAAVVARVLAAGDGPAALARATYDGVAGHPVLIGRDHWAAIGEVATGDEGARRYLADHFPTNVECGDLATGHDVDHAG
jgi:CTP:molybdopterin cytidylyltransferase MocA